MKSTKKLGEYEYWVACDSSLQIGLFLVLTRFCEIITVRAPNWRSYDKQEKQAKKHYFQASDSVFQIGNVSGSNRVQRKFHRKSSKM